MRTFMDDDFLLRSPMARELYHGFAEEMPIIDYHCHINPAEIAENRQFETITQVWLGGDHYKWRLMRANGVDERLITGDRDDRDKFRAFAACLPKAVGNPVYHWAHLELRRYFGYAGVLNEATAEKVWNLCNERLRELPVREIIRRANVEVICTTDDPCDDMAAHIRLRREGFETHVLPGWRPDKAMNIRKPDFAAYIRRLSSVSGVSIKNLDSLREALRRRLAFFDGVGCRISDHGLDFVPFAPVGEREAEWALRDALAGKAVSPEAAEAYQYALLLFLGEEYARLGWVMQLHYGALRNANSRMFICLGPDTGYDAIGAPGGSRKIAGLLNALDSRGALPKTVLYSLNPNDNAMLTSLIGCFQHGISGKLQHGAAWWFNDTKTGMERQLTNLAEQSLLGNFIGMLTDSRSFLSYTRHEYFRRILCNLLGDWVENGELPGDMDTLGRLVQDVCYGNISKYLK